MTALSDGAPEQAPRWDLVDTESCGGGIRFFAPYLVVWGYVGIYRRKEYVGGAPRGPRGWWVCLGGRHAPLPHGLLVDCLTSTPSPLGHVCSKKIAAEGFVPFGLCLIFLFFETLKQAKNSNSGLGLRLIG